jgi:putative ABC transport system permease protein
VFRISLRGLLTHKVRLVATAVAVLSGVAFLTGTQVLTASVTRSFETLFDDAYDNIDVIVRSTDRIETRFGPETARVPDDLVPLVRAVDGVAAAAGHVEGLAILVDGDGEPVSSDNEPPTFAYNWIDDPALNNWSISEGRAPSGADDVVIDRRTAERAGFRPGDRVTVAERQTGSRQLEVVGIATFLDEPSFGGLTVVLLPSATARELVGEPGKSNWIAVAGQDGVSQQELRDRIAAVLPEDTEAITGESFTEENRESFTNFIDLIRQALLVFGYVALGVGAFIIYNTFSVIVAQRGRELALLRAVGASRPQIGLAVLVESLVVGAIAAVAGVAAGVGLGWGLVRLLVALGFGLTSLPMVAEPSSLATAAALGTAITALSALLPAWRASRVPPLAALRDVSLDRPSRLAIRSAAGASLIALGGIGVVRTLLASGALELVGLYAVAVFAGMVVLGPVLAPPFVRAVGRPLPAIGRISALLARENAARNPRRTAATASALMVGVGLVAFIAVAADSVKSSTTDAVDRAVRGDFIITSEGAGVRALSPNLAEELRASTEIEAVTTFRVGFAEIAGEGQLVVAVDPSTFSELVDIDVVDGAISRIGPRGVAVPRTVAEARGWRIGQAVPITFRDTGNQFLQLDAIYDAILPAPGDGYLISHELHTANFPEVEQTDHTVYVKLRPGTTIDAGRSEVEAIAGNYPSARVQDLTEFKQQRLSQINQFLVVLYALLALALVIAVIGIVNTLLLAVYERTREIGLLRAVGMSRRQVAASICWESVLIALLGAFTGLLIGLFFGWALVKGLEDEGARVFTVPAAQLIGLVVLAALAGVGAALYPAWRAARLDVLEAIATE